MPTHQARELREVLQGGIHRCASIPAQAAAVHVQVLQLCQCEEHTRQLASVHIQARQAAAEARQLCHAVWAVSTEAQ